MELTLLTILEKGGFLAVSGFLLYLIKKTNDRIDRREKERKEEKEKHEKEHEKLTVKVEGISKDYVPKEDHKILAAKVDAFECEYVPKGEFFQDVSGWRGDVQRLFERVDGISRDLAYFKGRYDGVNDKGQKDGK